MTPTYANKPLKRILTIHAILSALLLIMSANLIFLLGDLEQVLLSKGIALEMLTAIKRQIDTIFLAASTATIISTPIAVRSWTIAKK